MQMFCRKPVGAILRATGSVPLRAKEMIKEPCRQSADTNADSRMYPLRHSGGRTRCLVGRRPRQPSVRPKGWSSNSAVSPRR